MLARKNRSSGRAARANPAGHDRPAFLSERPERNLPDQIRAGGNRRGTFKILPALGTARKDGGRTMNRFSGARFLKSVYKPEELEETVAEVAFIGRSNVG